MSALSERLSARRPGSTARTARSGALPVRPSRSSCSPCTVPLPWHDTPYQEEELPRHGPGVPQLRSGPGGAPSGPRSVSRNATSTSASVAAWAGGDKRRTVAAKAKATQMMRPCVRGRAMGTRTGGPAARSESSDEPWLFFLFTRSAVAGVAALPEVP